ncbi:3-deoxy-D-manno-octulosonic acid transferase [Loktanella fryxellensis]|uniref:3-deoxy-D-manno-octulosonic acid transferase n=1 Tax=Loktanella fryxellensis TaxID=245187 RepID=UPI0015A6A207|nr:3-deoxy-D-manno-octulosonic acid transferase [Loktanella fryxellensis]
MTRPPLPLRLYGWLTTLAAPLVHARVQRRLLAQGVAPARTRERLGHATQPRPVGPLVWIHGASVGETLSALPLIAGLLAQDAPPAILVTSGTATSAAVLARRLPTGAIHQFAPLDTGPALRRFHAHWRPDLLVLMESEIWPRMIVTAPCPVVLMNARLSARTLDRWRRLGAPARWLLDRFALIVTQTAQGADDVRCLGLAADRVRVGGNLKAAATPPAADAAVLAGLQSTLAGRPRWLAASTHAGEEAAILRAHRAVLAQDPAACLIFAPRHPDRADDIAALAAQTDLTLTRRSRGEAPTAQVHLADTLDEMGLWYRLSPIVFMGGSLVPVGGHNPWEGAALGCALLTGPHLDNCGADWAGLRDGDAAITDLTDATLAPAIQRLLHDPVAAQAMGARARALTAQQSADIDRTLADLRRLMQTGPQP